MIKLDFSRSKLRTQSIVEYNDKIIQYDKELEKEAILNLLKIYGNSSEAKIIIAKSLGVGIATLYRKLNFYNL